MSVDAGRGRLYEAAEQLRRKWELLLPMWTDIMRQQFEKDTWEPLDSLNGDALRAMDQLIQLLRQMRRECTG